MKNIITIVLAVFCLLLAGQAAAQVEVRIQPVRKEFLVGENVALQVKIENFTDRTVSFVNTTGRSWLHFTVAQYDTEFPQARCAGRFFPYRHSQPAPLL